MKIQSNKIIRKSPTDNNSKPADSFNSPLINKKTFIKKCKAASA